VAAFLSGGIDVQKLEDLLWGLMLVNPKNADRAQPHDNYPPMLSRAYALLKLTLLPGRLEWADRNGAMVLRLIRGQADEGHAGTPVKPEPTILARLQAADVRAACEVAARRLRASGFTPLASHRADGSRRDIALSPGAIHPTRLLAALLFPIPDAAVNTLADLVLRRPAESLT
jgi:CRISPR-associated protein Csx17